MDHERLRSWTKLGIVNLSLLTLVLVLIICQSLRARATETVVVAFQVNETHSPTAARDANSRTADHSTQGAQKPVQPSDLIVARPQLAPPARPWPFLRLVAIILTGLLINAARMARKFRRFLGLGVFGNGYSILFLMLAVAISGFPVTFETTLSSQLGPWTWIAELSGVIAAAVLPAVRLKAGPASTSPALGFDITSSNPLLAVIEDGIRDHILARMQAEIVLAARRYSWDEIKLAAHRVIEEEMTVGRLDYKDGETAIQSTDAFQPSVDSHTDFENKYTALIRLLRTCSFSRLRPSLAAAAREIAA